MRYAFLTDPGVVRDHNEDAVDIVKDKSGEILMIVCDGMGGHKDGEVASFVAIKGVTEEFKNLDSIGTKEDAIKFIQKSVSDANSLIYNYTVKHPNSKGMGTTIVLAIITSDYLLIGNIGDSSGFVLKQGKLYKITVDHTLVNLLLRSGEITEEQAKNHPRKNVLMRALGADMSVDMDIFNVERDVDGIFLCTDGLTNSLETDKIEKILNDNEDPKEKCERLIKKANNRGGNDNITACFLEMEDK